jgi:hypothetical protein
VQQYAEVHRQQLLQANPEELAAAQLPTFDLDSVDLPTLFPEVRSCLFLEMLLSW